MVRTDFLLNQIQSIAHVRTAPKLWQSYVKFLLQNKLGRSPLSLLDVKQLFHELSEICSKFFFSLYSRIYVMAFPDGKQSCPKKYLVVKVSGTLLVTYTQQCSVCAKNLGLSCSWYFTLDKRLDLNITFVKINFYIENLSCSNGRLKIYQQFIVRKLERLKYCGIYTLFNVYPNYHQVRIEIFSTKCFNFEVYAYYISMDNNLLRTSNANKHFSLIPPVDRVIVKRQNTTVQFCLIEGMKNTVVMLCASNVCELSVHDGPDTHGDQLTPHKCSYKLSTFQTFVVRKGNIHSSCVVSFRNEIPMNKTFSFEERTSLHLPSDNCLYSPKMCLISARSPQNYQLNVSLVFLSISDASKTPNCRHGGLTFVDHSTSLLSEISTICSNRSDTTNQKIYSSSSTLTFVLYWYTWPPPIKTVLLLTSTKCKAVVIEGCFLYFLGTFHTEYRHRSADLKQRTKGSGLKVRITQAKSLCFSVDKDKCVVLQIVKGKGLPFVMRQMTCFVRLKPDFDWGEPGRQLHLTVTGFLKQVEYADPDIIKFQGNLNQWKFQAQNVEHSHCDTRQCVPSLFVSPKSCNDSARRDTFFHFFLSLNLPVLHHIFHLTVKQLLYATFWLEVVLKNVLSKPKLSLSLDRPQPLVETFPFQKDTDQVRILHFLTMTNHHRECTTEMIPACSLFLCRLFWESLTEEERQKWWAL